MDEPKLDQELASLQAYTLVTIVDASIICFNNFDFMYLTDQIFCSLWHMTGIFDVNLNDKEMIG